MDTRSNDSSISRIYKGRVIPIIRGGSGESDLFPFVDGELADLSVEELAAHAEALSTSITEVTDAPETFVSEERPSAFLLSETREAIGRLSAVRAEIKSREAEPVEVALSDDEIDAFATLRAEADETPEPETEPEVEVPAEEPAEEAAAVVASVTPTPAYRPPARARAAAPAAVVPERIALTAAAGATDLSPGHEYQDEFDIANAMIRRHGNFGTVPEGVRGEKIPIARSEWGSRYPDDRRLGRDEMKNRTLVAAATNPNDIKAELQKRLRDQLAGKSLVASGGLCAPVTPYYELQMISTPMRPVMSSLPAFNADRGGLRYARPAGLSAVTTGVGLKTATEDGAGGTEAEKSCQIIECPGFEETDVDIIYHCLQFGNLGARTFPELVAQWNELVLAAHARLAESNLLTQIDTSSTQIEAGALGLGASATLFSQILAAANGLRSRNRMAPDAVLRLMLPWWAVDLIVSDVIRGQFQRFDTDAERVVALFRSFNVEPTFYIDGAAGRGQVFGTQSDGALLPFPEEVVWYLFPEGSFLYLDGGVLELGIVRDSVLNKTNDFQIFGETFENVAFVGIESYAVATPVCDSGTVSLPNDVTCPISYAVAS